jgi:hypothetical protein
LLAYVFFHHPAQGTDVAAYDEGLRRFHASLAEAGSPGFISSETYHSRDGYSDWYLVESSAALDALNDAAVTGRTLPLHDAVAHEAVDFAGKLYKLVGGSPGGQNFETRFSKPAGMSYRDLYALLKPWSDRNGVSLWRRMMVLGPPPEFCFLSPAELDLPPEMSPEVLTLKLV